MPSTPKLSLRKIKRADAENFADMMRLLSAFHGEESKANVADIVTHGLGANKISTIVQASLRGEPAGFVATRDWMDFVRSWPVRHIEMLFVHERFRRTGVGAALVGRVVSDSKAAGIQSVTVGVRTTNRLANAFYKKLGFENSDDYDRAEDILAIIEAGIDLTRRNPKHDEPVPDDAYTAWVIVQELRRAGWAIKHHSMSLKIEGF